MNPTSLFIQGFLLGLASGLACLASCAPVLLPVLLTGDGTLRRQSSLLMEFLTGRLLGYLLFALLAWCAGTLVAEQVSAEPRLRGSILLILGLVLLVHGLVWSRQGHREKCLVSPWKARRWFGQKPWLLPLGLGLLSGVNICAPFLVAITQGAASGSLVGALLFFSAFFLGTALFFLPAPLLGFLKNREALTQVGRFSALLVAGYYLFSSLPLLIVRTP